MLKNKTKGVVLAKKTKICKSSLSKAVGLMFSKKGKTLIFTFNKEKIIPLHMLFVFYPIDLLFLDKRRKVAEIKQNFKPFTFYTPRTKAQYIIELPAGAIKKANTAIGDTISFK